MAGPTLTTKGLLTQPAASASLAASQWADAAGTADVILAAFPTTVTALYDGLILGVRAAAANLTTTPTFAPDSLSAYTIKKGAAAALEAGDIAGDGFEMLLRFNLAGTYWELLNPYVNLQIPYAISTGSADALAAAFSPTRTLTEGFLVHVRANLSNATTAPTLATDGGTARIIYQTGKLALAANSILINHDCLFAYHADATPWWELLNPCAAVTGGTWAAAAGTVDAITATYSPAPTALFDGQRVVFRASGTNITPLPTFNMNSLGALIIYKKNKQPLHVGDLVINHEAEVTHHVGSPSWWELMNPAGGLQSQTIVADDTTATDVNTALGWFGSTPGFTVGDGMEYVFEGLLRLSRVAGTTSHTTATLFGGTATFDIFDYVAECNANDDAALVAHQSVQSRTTTPVTPLVCKAASTSATEQTLIRVRGRFKVAAAGHGTIIPQFILSAAAGGISTRKAGTSFRIAPAPAEGTWA